VSNAVEDDEDVADDDSDEEPSLLVEIAGDGWKRRLPLAILTVAPTAYLFTRIYLRTGDLGLALGAGVICPLCVYGVIGLWLDDTSAFTRSSWARWSANHADERPLIFAVVGAAVFVGFFTLMWLISPLVTRY